MSGWAFENIWVARGPWECPVPFLQGVWTHGSHLLRNPHTPTHVLVPTRVTAKTWII